MKLKQPIRLGLPKGSLQDATLALFRKAGFNIVVSSRSYKPSIDDPEIEVRLLRAQEISKYVEQGFLDLGLTGKDWIHETRADVHVVADLPFSKATKAPARWVLVVPENSEINTASDLEGKRIAAEAVNITKDYLKKKGVNAEVEFSWGATEVKVPELVDAIVDITETGSSLRANKLRIVDTLIESYPQLIANKKAIQDPLFKNKLDTMTLLLKGAMEARDKVGLKLNLPEKNLDTILKELPALRNPTVSKLTDPEWVALESIIDEVIVREIIPTLKEHGAEGIIEYPLNKVVY
ncbi:MAG: ATP phosphoribosyltransferase [Verrucomicrobiota bacterium]